MKTKSILIAIALIFAVLYVSVFAWVWADRNYTTNFWPDFFKWSAIAVGAILCIGWAIWWNKKK